MNQPTEHDLESAARKISDLRNALNAVLFGKDDLVELVMAGMLAGGNLLLEGLPGLGKTELVKGLAGSLGLTAKRIQFTPDLLPGDITGNPLLQEVDGRKQFVFQPGPVFTNLLLADEINRASPKTQSALLEAMQEKRVTVLGETHSLPRPFFVLATQNPIELEGTYPLPEAQLDRFLFKIEVASNPVDVLERIIIERAMGTSAVPIQVLSSEAFIALIELVPAIHMPKVVANYIARLVHATQTGNSAAASGIRYGSSPRGAQALAAAARARALIGGRPNVSFEDITAVAVPALQHRLILDYTARMEGQTGASVVRALLEEIPAQSKKEPATLQSLKV